MHHSIFVLSGTLQVSQMGAYLNKPVTEKVTESGHNHMTRYAAASMQGWRINQEVCFEASKRGFQK